MKARYLVCGAALLMITVAAVAQVDPQPARLKGNVRYRVRADYSRLSLLFKGPLTHTEELNGSTLTVRFSGVQSAVSASGANLHFHDGLVAQAVVDRIVDSRSTAVLTLRKGSGTYRINQDPATGTVSIDVFPGSAPSTIRPVAAVKPRKPATVESGPVIQAGRNQVVDFGAIARQEFGASVPTISPLDERNRTTTVAADAKALTPGFGGNSSHAFLLLLVLCVTLGLTLCGMPILAYLTLRKSRALVNSKPGPTARSSTDSSLAPSEHDVSREYRLAPSTRLSRDEESPRALEYEEPDEPSSGELAHQYLRNQADIELALKLRNQAQPPDAARKIKVITAKKLPLKGRVSAAKKLGVGKEELELAARLLRMSDANVEKEELE